MGNRIHHSTFCIALTIGDPSGIGPEVIAKALSHANPRPKWQPVLFGDFAILEQAFARWGRGQRLVRVTEDCSIPLKNNEIAVMDVPLTGSLPTKPEPSKVGGLQAGQSLDAAITAALAGRVRAIVTAPLSKKSLELAGYPFPGHTEFLAARCGIPEATMLMYHPRLAVALVTTHLPLAEVPRAITGERILRAIRHLAAFYQDVLGQSTTRIAVTGLNPHCGEGGRLGREEGEIIGPALAQARREGYVVEGPVSADALFSATWKGRFDAAIAMYHDQGLIPAKMNDVRKTVNVTLGLPFPRISPDFGTAFDIAGRGIADPASMIQAIRLAREWTRLPEGEAKKH